MEAQFKVPSVQGAAPPPPDPGTPEAGEPEAGVGVAVGPSWPLFSPGLSPAQLPLSMHISWLWLPSWIPHPNAEREPKHSCCDSSLHASRGPPPSLCKEQLCSSEVRGAAHATFEIDFLNYDG